MIETLLGWYTSPQWWGYVLRISSFFLLAWIIHLLGRTLADRIVRLPRFAGRGSRSGPQRRETLAGIIASGISITAYASAILATLAQFVDTTTLIWVVGLFSAAFGLGARPLISDFLTGLSLIFEDTFAVGDKAAFLDVEGVIEAVNLRTTQVRAPTGELFTVPNGEIRVVRNFSRGRFSTTSVTVKIAAADLGVALPMLEELGMEAVALLPNLLEPWTVISETAVIGQHSELTLLAKARFGKAAEMRPRLQSLVLERLADAGIALVD